MVSADHFTLKMKQALSSETLVSYTASQPRRPRLEFLPPWKPQISLRISANLYSISFDSWVVCNDALSVAQVLL